jgi:hypothetical protein
MLATSDSYSGQTFLLIAWLFTRDILPKKKKKKKKKGKEYKIVIAIGLSPGWRNSISSSKGEKMTYSETQIRCSLKGLLCSVCSVIASLTFKEGKPAHAEAG